MLQSSVGEMGGLEVVPQKMEGQSSCLAGEHNIQFVLNERCHGEQEEEVCVHVFEAVEYGYIRGRESHLPSFLL